MGIDVQDCNRDIDKNNARVKFEIRSEQTDVLTNVLFGVNNSGKTYTYVA